MRLWHFISREADAVAALAAIVGVVVTVLGFGLTWYQLQKTTDQLQSSNEYEIRRDLRELVSEMAKTAKMECLRAELKCEAAELKPLNQQLGLLFNFFHSVYRQTKASGVSRTFEDQMSEDFCLWFSSSYVVDFWDRQVLLGYYKAERIEMRRIWCGS